MLRRSDSLRRNQRAARLFFVVPCSDEAFGRLQTTRIIFRHCEHISLFFFLVSLHSLHGCGACNDILCYHGGGGGLVMVATRVWYCYAPAPMICMRRNGTVLFTKKMWMLMSDGQTKVGPRRREILARGKCLQATLRTPRRPEH